MQHMQACSSTTADPDQTREEIEELVDVVKAGSEGSAEVELMMSSRVTIRLRAEIAPKAVPRLPEIRL